MNDTQALRSEVMPNGNYVQFLREDPYGFWRVTYEKGSMPEDFGSQRFLSAAEAQRSFWLWYNARRRPNKKSKE